MQSDKWTNGRMATLDVGWQPLLVARLAGWLGGWLVSELVSRVLPNPQIEDHLRQHTITTTLLPS